MNVLRKPQNKWGWVRVAGLIGLAVIVSWTILATLLRGIGEVPWMAWSGYQAFSIIDAFELAVLPLLVVFGASWLEEQDLKVETEQATYKEVERAVAAQRKETLAQFHNAVLQVLPHTGHGSGEVSEQVQLKIKAVVQSFLPALDGKGKGEALHFLFEKNLLSGEHPLADLKGMDLRGLAAHKAHLTGVNLEGVDLSGAKLDGAHMMKAQLAGVNLNNAFLRNADLREAVLAGSNLSGVRLEGANLESVDLRGANLEGALLVNANLRYCKISGSPIGHASFNMMDEGDHQGNDTQILNLAILVDTIFTDGRKVTNDKGREFLKNKEIALIVDRL